MRLCPKLAHTCLRFLKRYPDVQERVQTYFQDSSGRFGYYGKQFSEKHKIPYALAVRMSAYFNLWLDNMDQLPELPDQPNLLISMKRCTFSYSSLAKFTTACRSKLCPWCRAVQLLKIERLAGAKPWARIDAKDWDIGESPPQIRTQPEASLTLRNVILKDGRLVLRLLYYFEDPARPVYLSTLSRLKACRELLDYDLAVLNSEYLGTWLKLAKGLRFFSKSARFA